MPAIRPIPADFTEVALKLGRSTTRIQGHYSAGQATVARWMAEAGIPSIGCSLRPVPDDFAQVAPTMFQSKLAKHYKTSEIAVKRWIKETGVKPMKGDNPSKFKALPVPDDFAELAPTMFNAELARHYGSSYKTIRRWLTEAGVEAKHYKPRPQRGSKAARSMANILPRQIIKTNVKSIYDEAADALRRERFPVNRCNEKGSFNPKGKFWRVGWSVLTGDELLERAARYRRAA